MIERLINIVPMVLPFFCILMISIYYATLFKRKVNETIFLSISTIILILFFSGILDFRGSLLLGYLIIILLSFFSLLLFIKNLIKDKGLIKRISLIQSIFIFLMFFILALYLNYGRMFDIWDEFSHWGIVVKSMYSFDALGTFHDSNILFKSYLPGVSLFQYFLIRPFQNFTEYPAYIGLNMIFFSIICTFIKNFNLRTILFIISGFLIPLLMGVNFYSSLYIDCILGILFGTVILFYYYFKYEQTMFGIVTISATICLLTITKDMGFFFAAMALLIIFLDSCIFRFSQIKKYFNKTKGFFPKVIKVIILTSPITFSMFFQLLWKLHLKITEVNSIWFHPSKINVKGLITGDLLPYQVEVIKIFKEALFNKAVFPLNYSIVSILVAILIFSLVLAVLVKKKDISRKRLMLTFLGLILGNIVYIGVLFIFYVFLITPSNVPIAYEALHLASYERYLFSYLIGVFFSFLLFILLESNLQYFSTKKSSFKNQLKITFFVFASFTIFNFLYDNTKTYLQSDILQARKNVHLTISNRLPYNKILEWSKYLSAEDSIPYIISQGDKGLDKLKLIYVLYPSNLVFGLWDYSVSLYPYFPELDDPWTKIINSEQWEQHVLNNYNQVYIFNYDQNFSNTYGHFFDKLENNALYKVTKNENGTLELVSIPKP